jgi:hypothetical protein
VTAQELRYAQAKILEEKWIPRLNDKSFFDSSEDSYYAVLTMARALYLFENGKVASKVKAAKWAYTNLDNKWGGLATAALSARGTQSFDHEKSTKDLILFTLKQSKQYL